jgi:hypothetical protein
MSKRFPGRKRHKDDFYPTPFRAVEPLIPYLAHVHSFAEPCAGDGDLIRHLESFGLICVWQGDIGVGQDALAMKSFGDPDAIITNPPHFRDTMHRLIRHFQAIAPTWLLIDADWAFTRQAAPFLPACTDIVPIGRVKWIVGSAHTGMDNYAWFRFDARHTTGPLFHWRSRGEDLPLFDSVHSLTEDRVGCSPRIES